MSDIMRPVPFVHLMNRILSECHAQGPVFDVSKLMRHADGKPLLTFEKKVEPPYGPAVGPHTQLVRNTIAAYAAGGRFFEAKTVQMMDSEELSKCVGKLCTAVADECCNYERSTELYVPQALAEYVKAWFTCKLLAKELELGDSDGFVLNMSVGYDLKGIQSPKVDAYIERMKDALGTEVWRKRMDWTLANLDRFEKVDEAYVRGIIPHVSNSVTESTPHGCPSGGVERIATYLITEKSLNTCIKYNPTLLGYEFIHKTPDGLGYDYIQSDDRHFREDPQWEDTVPVFHRLMQCIGERGLELGVKIINTFPVDTIVGELPGEEMYMSGRSLYLLSLSLAAQLAKELKGRLCISYSGSADIHSVRAPFDAGIWPVIMVTTALKPGGYQRLSQIGRALLDTSYTPWEGMDTAKAAALAKGIPVDGHCQKPMKPIPSRKLDKKVPLIDYFSAPCRFGHPIGQDTPACLMKVDEGRYEEVLCITTQRNALSFIAGTICSHRCQDRCMRNAYGESVYTRTQKLRAAEGGFEALLPKLYPAVPTADRRVAMMGDGPGGVPAAHFLGHSDVDVTAFEHRDALGGIVRHMIPAFRIHDEAIDNDVCLMEAMGVRVKLNTEVKDVQEFFAQGFTHMTLATGTRQKDSAGLEYGEEYNVIEFPEVAKKAPDVPSLGRHAVVIGDSSTAMDAARAVKCLPSVETISLVYRRTCRYIPVDQEELKLALIDGMEFREPLAPVSVRDGVLTCRVTELGAPDVINCHSLVDTGRTAEVPVDTVITAVGEKMDTELYTASSLSVDQRSRAVVSPGILESPVKHVFVVGNGRRGPNTMVEIIVDAARAAQVIHPFDADAWAEQNVNPDYQKPLAKQGDACIDCASCENSRCLGHTTVCETCTEVCPSRANVAVWVSGMRQRQVIHMDGMRNKCGNCTTFCPYDSHLYQNKFTLFWNADDFENSRNEGSLRLEDVRIQVRLGGQVADYDVPNAACGLYDPLRHLICAVYENYVYLPG